MRAKAPVVFIVDEDANGWNSVRLLAESIGLEVRTYSDGAVFLKEFSLDSPGCVVMGPRMRSMNALELQEELARRGAEIPVMMAVAPADMSMAVEALKAGAVDVIEQPAVNQRVVPVILRAIAADLSARSRQLVAEEIRLRYTQLTARERQVLRLVVEGATSSTIAARLGIREKTVEVYRSHINRKMRTRNAVELTRMTYDLV